MKHKEFYKTNQEFEKELSMGTSELKQAKKRLSELEFIKVRRRGVPAKSYYKVDIEKIVTALTRWAEIDQLDGRKPTNLLVENRPTNTESTTENTIDTNINKMVNDVLEVWNSYNPEIGYNKNPQRNAVKALVEKVGLDKAIEMTKMVIDFQGEQYAPSVTSPYEMKAKQIKIMQYLERNKK